MKKSFGMLTIKVLVVVALLFVFSSCKNKKKITDISNPQEVKAQIEEELVEEENVESVTKTKANDLSNGVVVKEPSKSQRLENYFGAIATAASATSANASIQEALTMFVNRNAPVLIVIYQNDGTTDYDEPTTIQRYLEYLKDTGNTMANVEEMVMDDSGKIKELVLKK